MTGLRVVLAEDDVLLREGLASLLERSGYEVAGQAGDGPQLLTLARQARPVPCAHEHPEDVRDLARALLEGASKEFPRRELVATVFDPQGERIGRARRTARGDIEWQR